MLVKVTKTDFNYTVCSSKDKTKFVLLLIIWVINSEKKNIQHSQNSMKTLRKIVLSVTER